MLDTVGTARALLETAYAVIDAEMDTKQWAVGDAFSMADCAAAPALFYANEVMPFGNTQRGAAAYLWGRAKPHTVVVPG